MIIRAEKLARQNSAYRHRKYEGRFRKRRRPSTFCDENMSVGLYGLADLGKRIRFHVRCFPTRLVFAAVGSARVGLSKLLSFEREVID